MRNMDQLIKDQITGAKDNGLSGEWNILQSKETREEIEEIERLVTTLYAKPSTGRPFLNLPKLKRSIYEETSFFSLNSFLLFSDIGNAAWRAALEINNNSTIELTKASLLEEDKSWQVIIRNPDMTVLVNSVRFKPIGKYISSFYNSIEINGEPATLMAFIKMVTEALKRKPWEDESGELDWGSFTKKTLVSRKEVSEQWALLANQPELLPDSLREIQKSLCQRCKKDLDLDWVFCPFCGVPSNNYY